MNKKVGKILEEFQEGKSWWEYITQTLFSIKKDIWESEKLAQLVKHTNMWTWLWIPITDVTKILLFGLEL